MTGGFKLWPDKEPRFQESTSTGSKTVFVEFFISSTKAISKGNQIVT
jgi:hypothetical protein